MVRRKGHHFEKFGDYAIKNTDDVIRILKILGITLGTVFVINKVATFANSVKSLATTFGLLKVSCDIFSAREAAQISIICPQPYFRAVNDLVSYFSDTEALFEFPFSIDKNGIEISRIERNIRKSIINTGETETGIIIQLYATGEVVNPIIYDVDEKTYLKLNYTMQQDDEIVINTNTGQKEIKLIRAGVETNIMGHLSPGSTWLQVEQGDNYFLLWRNNY